MKRLLLGFLALILGGCASVSTIEKRAQEKSSVLAAASAKHQRMIRRGNIACGFTPDMVYVALDHPDRINRLSDGRVERWFYYNFGQHSSAPYIGTTKVDTFNPNPSVRGAARNYYQNTYGTHFDPSETVDAWQRHLVVTFLDGKVVTIELFQM